MKQSIPKETPLYRDVTASELQKSVLTSSERNSIYKLIHNLNQKPLICTSLAIFLSIIFLLITLYNIKLYGFEGYGGMFIFIGLFLAVGFLSSRKLISPHAKCQKAQRGILNGIWSSTAQSRRSRTYYMDVIFPDTKARCRKVICCHRDYLQAESGMQILVVSFNSEKIYGVIIHNSIN